MKMPRTKIPKNNAKRNRDAAKEEKLRDFDSNLDQIICSMESKFKQDIDELDQEIKMMKSRLPQKMLNLNLYELMNMSGSTISGFLEDSQSQNRLQNASLLHNSNTGKKSRDDEGYLTEDSSNGGSSCGAYIHHHSQSSSLASNRIGRTPGPLQRASGLIGRTPGLLGRTPGLIGRTPGPLSSAKAQSRGRRSQSANGASGYLENSTKPKQTLEHGARSKLRTPISNRPKAISVDRLKSMLTPINNGALASPTFLRWPKPGETVISVDGSPIVAHILPEKFANVNIPVRNGVLSLRPKRIQNFDPELMDKIDPETLQQLKLLQSNLKVIMSYANKN